MQKPNFKKMVLNQFVPLYLLMATSTPLSRRPYKTDKPSGDLIGRDGNKIGEVHSGDLYKIDSNSRTGLRYERSI
ncbi:hypothetical protein K9L16_00220 [Candidatus Pacearchaeota archaeon]|nr:hypothetical protein [Candidatus Pacearchaeota archaeon]